MSYALRGLMSARAKAIGLSVATMLSAVGLAVAGPGQSNGAGQSDGAGNSENSAAADNGGGGAGSVASSGGDVWEWLFGDEQPGGPLTANANQSGVDGQGVAATHAPLSIIPGATAASLAGLNAYNANENAYVNASPNSRVGLIAIYAASLVSAQNLFGLAADLLAPVGIEITAETDFIALLAVLNGQLVAAGADLTEELNAQIAAIQAYLDAVEATSVALNDAANPNRVPVDKDVKLYLDQQLEENGILDYYRDLASL